MKPVPESKIPANSIILSPSKVKQWQYCHQAYYYKYERNLQPKRKKVALYRGSVIHEIIEAYHNEEDWEAKFDKFEAEFNKLFDEEKEHLGENLPQDIWLIVMGYMHQYEDDPLQYIDIEETFGPYKLAKGVYIKGKVDRIAVDKRGHMWVTDTKTKKSFPNEVERQMNMQGPIYMWLARKAGYTPLGMMWDYVRTKAPVIPETLKNGTLSKRKNMDTTWAVYLSEIERQGLDPDDYQDMRLILQGKDESFYQRIRQPVDDKLIDIVIETVKEQGLRILEYGQYPIRELNWQCPNCDFHSLCWAEMVGLDADFIERTDFEPRKGDDNGEEEEA